MFVIYWSLDMTVTTKNICILGDSIAYGAWDSGGGWADRLRRSLHERTMFSKFLEYYWVYNLGIPGNTTDDLKRRFAIERAAREPHCIVFAIGINDSARIVGAKENRVPLPRFVANIEELLRESLQYTKEIVCVGFTPVDEMLTSPFDETCHFSNEQVLLYDKTLRDTCDRLEVSYLEIYGQFDPVKDLYDGLHPNDSGNKKIHGIVERFILSKREKQPPSL